MVLSHPLNTACYTEMNSVKRAPPEHQILWLGVLLAAALLVLDLLVFARIDSAVGAAFNTLFFVLSVLLIMLLQYLFPSLARFETGTLDVIKNACLMALGQLPKTLLLTAASAGSIFITLYNEYTLSYALPVWFVLGFALLAFGNSGILVKIFDLYINKPEE